MSFRKRKRVPIGAGSIAGWAEIGRGSGHAAARKEGTPAAEKPASLGQLQITNYRPFWREWQPRGTPITGAHLPSVHFRMQAAICS